MSRVSSTDSKIKLKKEMGLSEWTFTQIDKWCAKCTRQVKHISDDAFMKKMWESCMETVGMTPEKTWEDHSKKRMNPEALLAKVMTLSSRRARVAPGALKLMNLAAAEKRSQFFKAVRRAIQGEKRQRRLGDAPDGMVG